MTAAATTAAGEHHGKRHGHDDRGRHNGNAVLRSALFGSKTTAHGGPTLFGVAPGGIDWVINGKSRAKVSRDGRVRVRIEGLVFAEGPNVGKNTVPQLAATVYCGGAAVGTTKAVPFSPEGDARIDETLATALPQPMPGARRADQPGAGRHPGHRHATSRRAGPSAQTGRLAQRGRVTTARVARPPALSAAASPRASVPRRLPGGVDRHRAGDDAQALRPSAARARTRARRGR